MSAPNLVVVSYYDRRPAAHLRRLLRSFATHDAGAPYDLAIVANRTSDAKLDLPLPPGATLLERENLGMNVGAWDHGWRTLGGYSNYLFLQDECFAVRENWLGAFVARAAEPQLGLLGESLNAGWDKPWADLRRQRAGERMADHTIEGAPADRVDVYLDFMRRHQIDPGARGSHLRSLTWCARRDVLQAIDGFPIGANYGECIAAEIAVSRKVKAAGLSIAQISDEPFRFFRHAEYNQDCPGAPFTHKAAPRLQPAVTQIADVHFHVASADPHLASTRYRAMVPAFGLEQRGTHSSVSDQPLTARDLAGKRTLVIAKAFRPADLAVAFEARKAGVPIILDLCDNIFVSGYLGGYGELNSAVFKTMAQWAAVIVTTGPALADVLQDMAPAHTPIVVIPDAVETPEFVARAIAQPRPRPSWRDRTLFAAQNPMAAWRRASARLAPTAPSPAIIPQRDAAPNEKTVIWFGNHGAEHSDFGMLSLNAVIPHLARAAQTTKLRLLIVSNSRDKFSQHFANLSFPAEYRDWDAQRIFSDLDDAEICLLPNPRDTFSLCKSANRVSLALSRGAAVIATDFPALADFRDCVVIDDWARGLERYLTNEDARRDDIAKGQAVIARDYSVDAIARRWESVLASLPEQRASRAEAAFN